MNRDKALTIADRIMARIEADKAIHKDAIADEIQAGDALDEIVDVISHDGEKWVHRDGTPFDTKLHEIPDGTVVAFTQGYRMRLGGTWVVI